MSKLKPPIKMQIGKNGLTENFLKNLENAFKERENARISILKAAGHTKENVENMASKIINKLGNNFTYKTLGFSIFLKKWRKAKR